MHLSCRPVIALLLFLLAATSLAAQTSLRLCELNAENFFDTQHQPGHDDEEFTPQGARRWHLRRYWQKQQHMAKLLISMGCNRPPDVIALCEVENDTVLRDLCSRSLLRRVGYRFITTRSHDSRGINVALLYQPETFKPVGCDTLHMDPSVRTRDMLHVAGRLVNGDTLHVYVVHLSSRVGGRRAVRNRRYECERLMDHIRRLRRHAPDARIVITGDFNDTPSSPLLRQWLGVTPLTAGTVASETAIADTALYNISGGHAAQSGIAGTYKYNGRWETIDQCIVSGNLLRPSARTRTSRDAFHIWAPPFILETDPEDLLLKPSRTYNGYKYNGGYSDHLPIYTDFDLTF
jgi:endonuclease/exonuclease/phosphatase family metal-dependent hydrolase